MANFNNNNMEQMTEMSQRKSGFLWFFSKKPT